MKQFRSKFPGLSRRAVQIVALVALLTCALPLVAQSRAMGRSQSFEQIDAVRSDLLSISDRLVKLSPNPETRKQLRATKQRLGELTDEEFSTIAEPLAGQLARLNDSLESLEDYVNPSFGDEETVETQSVDTGVPGVCEWPCVAPYPDVQAFGDDQNGTAERGNETSGGARTFSETYTISCNGHLRTNFQTRFNLRSGLLIAELIKDIAGRLCDQSIFVFGVGTDFSIACIVTDFAYHAVRVFDEFPALCDGIINSAEIEGAYDRIGYIHDEFAGHDLALASHSTAIGNLNDANTLSILNRIAVAETNLQAVVASHNTLMLTRVALHDLEVQAAIASHDTDVKAQGATHDADVKAQGATHDTDVKAILNADTAFFLQTSIERALKRRMRLGGLYLPESMGGQAETARQIVVDAIAAVTVTGEPIYSAQYALYQADQTWNWQQYKRSWSWLCKAYREATKILGEAY